MRKVRVKIEEHNQAVHFNAFKSPKNLKALLELKKKIASNDSNNAEKSNNEKD